MAGIPIPSRWRPLVQSRVGFGMEFFGIRIFYLGLDQTIPTTRGSWLEFENPKNTRARNPKVPRIRIRMRNPRYFYYGEWDGISRPGLGKGPCSKLNFSTGRKFSGRALTEKQALVQSVVIFDGQLGFYQIFRSEVS